MITPLRILLLPIKLPLFLAWGTWYFFRSIFSFSTFGGFIISLLYIIIASSVTKGLSLEISNRRDTWDYQGQKWKWLMSEDESTFLDQKIIWLKENN